MLESNPNQDFQVWLYCLLYHQMEYEQFAQKVGVNNHL